MVSNVFTARNLCVFVQPIRVVMIVLINITSISRRTFVKLAPLAAANAVNCKLSQSSFAPFVRQATQMFMEFALRLKGASLFHLMATACFAILR